MEFHFTRRVLDPPSPPPSQRKCRKFLTSSLLSADRYGICWNPRDVLQLDHEVRRGHQEGPVRQLCAVRRIHHVPWYVPPLSAQSACYHARKAFFDVCRQYWKQQRKKTRMHSSRMRTGRSLPYGGVSMRESPDRDHHHHHHPPSPS